MFNNIGRQRFAQNVDQLYSINRPFSTNRWFQMTLHWLRTQQRHLIWMFKNTFCRCLLQTHRHKANKLFRFDVANNFCLTHLLDQSVDINILSFHDLVTVQDHVLHPRRPGRGCERQTGQDRHRDRLHRQEAEQNGNVHFRLALSLFAIY